MDSEKSLPEITIKAVLLGIVLSVVLAGANAYLGLFAGMTVSASIPAAVVSMGLLRLFRRSNILENNIVQTAASAGESLAAGVIFTLPALVLLDFWKGFDFWAVTLIAGFGGVLGVLFTIPLRRALIVQRKLKFPEGIATAEVLKSGQRGGSEIKYIAQASAAGGLFKLGAGGLGIWTETMQAAKGIGGSILYFGSNLSPALLSVGYIVGLNIAVLIFIGGFCNWLIAIPVHAAMHEWPVDAGEAISALDYAKQIWAEKTRYIGVGGMLVGGLWTIVKLRSSLYAAVSNGLKAYKGVRASRNEVARTERDIPARWVAVAMIASVVPLFVVYQVFVGKVAVTLPMAVIMLVLGFLFSAVAAYMAGLVGSSNNPVSGVTIATVLVSALLLVFLMGRSAANGPAAAIIIGSVVCCAAAIAGDNMQDLKAGWIVSATPWKQQVMQMVGTVSAALVMAPILKLLLTAYGFTGHSSAKAEPLAAPQAGLMASVARGVFEGGLPWGYVIIGMAVAVGIIAFDVYLEKKRASFRMPVLAVAIGFYLPFQLEVPILIGGLVSFAVGFVRRRRAVSSDASESADRRGLLLASGLITGEALIGIAMAIPIVISGNPKVLEIQGMAMGSWPGVVLLAGIGYWLYRVASGHGKHS